MINNKRVKTGGRAKGTPNKVTTEIKDVFKQIIECNLSQIETDIMELNPKDRIDVILKLSEYVLPKLQRSSIEMERENNGLEIVVIRGEKFKDKNNEIEEEYY
jgi:predicted lipase